MPRVKLRPKVEVVVDVHNNSVKNALQKLRFLIGRPEGLARERLEGDIDQFYPMVSNPRTATAFIGTPLVTTTARSAFNGSRLHGSHRQNMGYQTSPYRRHIVHVNRQAASVPQRQHQLNETT